MPDLNWVLDTRVLTSAISAVAGALFWNFVSMYRGRIKTLEYSVTHERVGLSAQDAIFGTVAVTWQGQPVNNLYVSTVTIENTTSIDHSNLRFKVYTGNTLLLTERREIAGTTHVPSHTQEWLQSVQVSAGAVPTPVQTEAYYHSREYLVPILNRKQRAIFTYLTTVPNQGEGPSVWVDLLHAGASLSFRPVGQQIYGVPVRIALAVGWLVCLLVFLLASLFVVKPWVAAAICLVAGLAVQGLGAALYRIFRFVKQVILR